MELRSSFAVSGTRSVSRRTTSRRARTTRAERNLERIVSGERLANIYRDESRFWWDLADDELVDRAVADPRFGDFVTVMQLCTDLGLEEVCAQMVGY